MQQPFDWGGYIVLYFFCGGVAAGAYFTAALAEIFGGKEDRAMAKVGYYIAFPLVLVCAVLLIVDLGRPERFWELIVTPTQSFPNILGWWPAFKAQSPIQIGGYALMGFGFFSLLSLLDVWVEEGRLKFAPLRAFYNAVPRKLYAAVGVLFGFFLAGYTGVLLNTTAQAMWAESTWIGALFIASAASTGAGAIGLVMALRHRPDATDAAVRLTRMDNAAIVLEVVLLIAVLLTATTLARALLTGPFLLWFLLFAAL
ncbi:MAG: NrfD/PsrC family molybdoenzyme membrane anchor subunit, partial [Chloroflexota bacterium]